MNPTNPPFPNIPAALKLPRRDPSPPIGDAAVSSSGELAGELAALAEREANLRAYEARLRAWQERLDAAAQGRPAAGTSAPFPRAGGDTSPPSDPALSAAWDKLYRARSLFEAEQNQLRDDRMALRDREEQLRRGEAALLEREARVAERERLLATPAAAPILHEEPEKPRSTLQRLTQAPWGVFKSSK